MTLEALLHCEEPDTLEKLTDKQLDEILSPYYNVTRPELAAVEKKSVGKMSKQNQMEFNMKMRKMQQIAKKFGVEI